MTYLSLLLMTSSGYAHLDRQRNMACREVARPASQKIGEVSCTERTGQGNDNEFIPTVKMEIRLPVEGSLGNKFPSIYNNCGVMAA